MLNDLHAMHAHESAASCQRPAKMRHRYFWGSSGRKFKSCQPDRCFRSSEAVSEKFEAAFSLPGGGYVRQPVRQPAAVTVPTLR